MTAPSPICLVNGSSTPPTVIVTGGSSVTIQLADLSGVSSWSLTCIGTDELNSSATIQTAINAGLNNVTKSSIFTFPSTNGCSLIFKSIVNNGLDASGSVDPTLSTTFKVASLTGTGFELGAQNETFEADVIFGWLKLFNAKLRA